MDYLATAEMSGCLVGYRVLVEMLIVNSLSFFFHLARKSAQFENEYTRNERREKTFGKSFYF